MLSCLDLPTPVGTLRLLAAEDTLLGLRVAGQRRPEVPARQEVTPTLRAAADWLERYFAGLSPDPDALPLRPVGTDFQLSVWAALRRIPYGTTASYGSLARSLHTAPRAVGVAAGRNPLLILIPCHRLIGADGSLTGYAGGLAVKEALLRLEGSWPV